MLSSEHFLDLAGGKFNQTSAADLSRLFAAAEQSPAKDHLVVHFHGGLVSRAAAETAAEGLMPCYKEAGAYPVFFFWRSDLWTTLSQNLGEIAQEPSVQTLSQAPRATRALQAKLKDYAGAKSGGPLPLSGIRSGSRIR